MLALLRQRDFALLWTAGVISTLGDFVLGIALPFYVYDQTGSALATGTMIAAGTVPRILVGSVAGVFVDRWDRRRTMVVADLSRALLLLSLLAIRSVEQLWLVYLVAFCQALVGLFFEPARSALLPRLVATHDLTAANSLDATGRTFGRLLGPLLGGALMATLGLTSVVLIDSVSFVMSAILVSLLATPTDPTVRAAKQGVTLTTPGYWVATWRGWVAGLRLVVEDRVLATLFALKGLVMVGEGIINVLWVAFVKQALGAGAQELGWLSSAFGLGAIAGGAMVARLGNMLRPSLLAGVGLTGTGALWLLMVNLPWLPLALVVMVLNGLVAMGSQVGPQTLLQRQTADELRGRVFATLGTTEALMRLSGLGLAAAFGDLAGVVPVLTLASLLFVLAGALALSRLDGIPSNSSA
jgi:MFS family permease